MKLKKRHLNYIDISDEIFLPAWSIVFENSEYIDPSTGCLYCYDDEMANHLWNPIQETITDIKDSIK